MTKQLQMAEGLSLPLDAITETIAILAKRRVGKSFTARRLAEQIFRAGQQVVLVDPKGDHWGIKSAADGKSPGAGHFAVSQRYPHKNLLKGHDTGFVTTTGRYVDRKEGARIALATGQIRRLHYQPDTLFSEDFNHPDDAPTPEPANAQASKACLLCGDHVDGGEDQHPCDCDCHEDDPLPMVTPPTAPPLTAEEARYVADTIDGVVGGWRTVFEDARIVATLRRYADLTELWNPSETHPLSADEEREMASRRTTRSGRRHGTFEHTPRCTTGECYD